MDITRRRITKVLAASPLLIPTARSAFAFQALESTSLICGFAAGGTADTMCRKVSPRLSPGYAKVAFTDNRTGAGGQIAITYVKGRPADGTSVLMTPTSMLTIYPHIYKRLAYDPAVDITPVSLGCVFNYGFAVGPTVPASVRTAPEFLEWAKAHPEGANYGSPGAGTTAHFIGNLLGQSAGIDMRHAAYRGTQPAMLDLLGGNVSAVFGPVGDISQHLATGKVRILAVSAEKRSRFAPSVPTFAEQGLKDMAHTEWFGFYLPAKAPRELVDRLNAELRSALATQSVIDGLATFGLEAMSSSSDELRSLVAKDTIKWSSIVKNAGFTVES